MRKLILYLIPFGLLLWKVPQSFGQLFPRMKQQMREASYEKPHFIIGLDSRRSFIENREVNIFGARVGVEFDRRWRVGLGFYGLASEYERTFIVDGNPVQGRLNFNYLAWFFEYVPFRNKRWEFSIPGYLGGGTSRFRGVDSLTRKTVGVSELSVQGHFKIFNWIGIGAGVGYRFLFIPNNQLEENFNNFIYNFKIQFWPGVIYRKIFNKENKWDREWQKEETAP